MEGILTQTFDETFLCGWTVIYNNDTKEYSYECSAKVNIPKEIDEIVKNNQEKYEKYIPEEYRKKK